MEIPIKMWNSPSRPGPHGRALALPAVSMARGAPANGRARRASRDGARPSWRPGGPAGAALPRGWSRPGEKAPSPRAPAARAAPAAPPAPRCLPAPSKGRVTVGGVWQCRPAEPSRLHRGSAAAAPALNPDPSAGDGGTRHI